MGSGLCRHTRRVVRVRAARQTKTDDDSRTLVTNTPARRGSPVPSPDEEETEGWGWLDGERYLQRWDVPWGWATLVFGLVGWGAAFVLVGGVVAPLGAAAAGVKLSSLSPQGQSLYILSLQSAETAVGFWVVNTAVKKFQPLPSDFLRIDAKGPLAAPNGWAVWAILGMPTAFATVAVITGLCSLGGVDQVSGQGTTDGVIPMLDAADPTSVLSLILVTAVLAPLVEEYLFRGFVLTSLTRYMPTPAAVGLSAALFAGAHFAPKDAPQLFALGLVLGASYVRTRNLLTPMLIHGMWNGGVLTLLLVLQAAGYDVGEVVRGN